MRFLIGLLLLADMIGPGRCGKDPEQPYRRSRPEVLPAWINSGSGALGERLVGVGVSAGIKNARMRRDTADNRARAELTKVLVDFAARLAAGPELDAVNQQAVTSDAVLLDHFVTGDGTEYALAGVELAAWKKRAAAALDAGQSDLPARADAAFAELSAPANGDR